ncbi:MAG: hypothetical protein O7G85_06340 [Planctomycetota bacterium]|nr:hypothetical protein [Planctomycetota bacterium]
MRDLQVDDLHFEVPESWEMQEPSSSARKAQFVLPGAGSDEASDANLVIYYFGSGGAGNLQANIDRWVGQFEDESGNPPTSTARIEERTVADTKILTVDVAGRYVAETSPGSGEHVDQADYRMLAAVIDAPAGRYYVKAVGPRETIDLCDASFTKFLDSLQHRPTGSTVTGSAHP